MSGASSSVDALSTRLERIRRPEMLFQRPDDPRLGELIEFWEGNPQALAPGRAVIVGFPHDQGVKRNHGRPGAAEAPHAIRQALYRLTRCDPQQNVDLAAARPLDLGNIPGNLHLEDAQQLLGDVVGSLLDVGAIPIVLGGGHETAYGQYLGYVKANDTVAPRPSGERGWGEGRRQVAIINFDAHLDIRLTEGGLGHSGTPFRQAMEHPTHPLPASHYLCIGAQPFAVSSEHARYLGQRGGNILWAADVRDRLPEVLTENLSRLDAQGCSIFLSIDADSVHAADVPGVSAPNPAGLRGRDLALCARIAGRFSGVSSFELAEVNPSLDRDHQSARWAALTIWSFLAGIAERHPSPLGGDGQG
jgi:formiminoglutamase